MKINSITVILVDDHPLVKQGIRKTLEKSDIEIIGESEDADGALRTVSEKSPDILIADISLKGSSSGIDLVKALNKHYPEVKTLILSMHNEPRYIENAIKAGARGYVTKREPLTNVLDAIKTIMAGNTYISPEVSGKVINKLLHVSTNGNGTTHDIFTDRELEVFKMIGTGFTAGEIARELTMSVNTVESHKKNIKRKLDLEKGSELLKVAIKWVHEHNKQ